jgi:hypothetical protein
MTPLTLMSHSTSTTVLSSPYEWSVTVFRPLMGPSVIVVVIDFIGSNDTVSLHNEFLKAITTSLSTVFSDLLILFIDLVPCQYTGSLSMLDIIAQTLDKGALICLEA